MNALLDQNLTPTAHHLTPDQIDDHLIGDLAPTLVAHLAACSLCADRVATAASPIASFRQVSTAWSERRSATLPIPVPTAQRPVWQRHMNWATASLSLAFGIAFLNASHQFSFNTAPQPSPTRSISVQQTAAMPLAPGIASEPRPTEISADNHMLSAINASFDASNDSPADLGLTAAVHHGPRASIRY